MLPPSPGSIRPVALITGAARRIGREIALELARAGYDIGVHWHRSECDAHATAAALQALGARAELLQADLADAAACESLVPQLVQRLGRVDAVVNNASLFEYDDLNSFSDELMLRHMRANVAPAVRLARALHAAIPPEVPGCVVNLLDQKLQNLNPDYFSYTLSKAALQAATVMLAQQLAPRVRVAAVAPGVTLTSDRLDAQGLQRAGDLMPLRRSSTPQDVARAVRFLLESPAVTGTTLVVDGGEHLMHAPRDIFRAVENVDA